MKKNGLNKETLNNIKYVLLWTIIFVITSCFAFAQVIKEKYFFLRRGEAVHQKLWTLYHIRTYWECFINDISNGIFTVPQYDYSLSLGESIIPTLSWSGYGDPLNIIAIFFSTNTHIWLIQILTFIRLWLAGIAFLYYCKEKNMNYYASLCGALVYVFTSKNFFNIGHQIPFLNALIQFPLLLLGVELIKKNGKRTIFYLSVLYSALCGFYFLWMMTVAGIIYVIIDIFLDKQIYKKNHIFYNILVTYILGICSSSILLIPNIIGFFMSNRNDNKLTSDLFYVGEISNLDDFALQLVNPTSYACICVIAIFSLVILLCSKGLYKKLKFFLLLLIVMYIIPIGGSLMNGFSYSSDRWIFILNFFWGYITSKFVPCLCKLEKNEKVGLIIINIFYFISIFSNKSIRNDKYYLVSLVIMLINFSFILILQNNVIFENKLNYKTHYINLFIIMIMINITINGYYYFSPQQYNRVSSYVKQDSYLNNTDPLNEVIDIINSQEESYYRIDGSSFSHNWGWSIDIPSINTNWSIINGYVSDFFANTGNNIIAYPSCFISEQRTIEDSLLSVKYQIEKKGNTNYIPYGFNLILSSEDYNYYNNNYALPLGYTYDAVVSYDQIDDLQPLMKSELMLYAIALEDCDFSEKYNINDIYNTKYEELTYKVCETDFITWNEGKLEVLEDNAVLELECDIPSNVEAYVQLEDLNINNSGEEYFDITIKTSSGVKRSERITSDLYNWHYYSKYRVINLGYDDNERNTIQIIFPKKGSYSLSDINILFRSMDDIPERYENLTENSLQNIVMTTNKFSGTISLDKEKVLCISVPYAKGWSAYVDGEKVNILRGNYMFMALVIPPGDHVIEFSYTQPGLILGTFISLLGIFSFLLWIVIDKKKDNFRRKEIC